MVSLSSFVPPKKHTQQLLGSSRRAQFWPNGKAERGAFSEVEWSWTRSWDSNRRIFGNQTSDNMERWKSSQQGEGSEEKKIRRKKTQVREKVGKSQDTVFFRGFVAPEGWKVGSLKRRVRRHLGRWEMKSCTPLWREADFEVKRYKTPQRRATFGSWDVEKVHGVVAWSTFGSKMC